MIKNLLATVGFAVIVHYGYQHYLHFQRLKSENEHLRQRWKDCVGSKPP
ncbi:hypothetical protein [Alcaligenes faecalis]|nr:hypothetical protein [Alcaligenes faecalis]